MNCQVDEEIQAPDRVESNPLMSVYNPPPLRPERPPRYYWEQSSEDVAPLDDAVQAAYGN
jgi:hypothetical protein